jgi:hypothetical protein
MVVDRMGEIVRFLIMESSKLELVVEEMDRSIQVVLEEVGNLMEVMVKEKILGLVQTSHLADRVELVEELVF